MLIESGNIHSRLIRATVDEEKWLDRVLSFKDKSFRARVFGDGRTHLFSKITKTFPSGLVTSIRKRAKKDGQKVNLIDRRKVPCAPDPTACIDWLREHQLDALRAAERTPRGVFHHVTGAGKTEIMVGLAELFPVRWVIFTNSKDLLYQIQRRFLIRTGESIGIWGDDQRNLSKRITVVMFQTAYKALEAGDKLAKAFLGTVQGLSVDECHIVPAGTFRRVLQACKGAYFRYGFSGTPFARTDQKSLLVIASLGPRIHRFTAQQGIDLGFLAKPRIQLTPVRHKPQQGAGRGVKWVQVYDHHIVKNPDRNHVVVELAKQAIKPTFLFVKALDHGRTLEKQIRAAGINVEFVWGKKPTPVRKAALQRLVHGDVDIIVCNVIFQQGIDIPELRSIIIASAGKSAIMVLQNTGRGTRRHNENGEVVKDEFTVYDIQDIGCGCKGAHPACKWLETHTRDRLAAYAMEKYPVFIKQLQRGVKAA